MRKRIVLFISFIAYPTSAIAAASSTTGSPSRIGDLLQLLFIFALLFFFYKILKNRKLQRQVEYGAITFGKTVGVFWFVLLIFMFFTTLEMHIEILEILQKQLKVILRQ